MIDITRVERFVMSVDGNNNIDSFMLMMDDVHKMAKRAGLNNKWAKYKPLTENIITELMNQYGTEE